MPASSKYLLTAESQTMSVPGVGRKNRSARFAISCRSEEHTSELQSPDHLVCRLLLEKKKQLNDLGKLDIVDLNLIDSRRRDQSTSKHNASKWNTSPETPTHVGTTYPTA